MDDSMKLVILDRDGVINYDSDAYIKKAEEWQPIPGSLGAIAALNNAGVRVVVASNQSGLGRGLFEIKALNGIHRKMHDLLSRLGGHLDGVFFCPHVPEAQCSCRKPKPGLYLDIMQRFAVTASEVYVIGDRKRDLNPARSIGATPVLVRTGHGRETERKYPDIADSTHDNLARAVSALLEQAR
jgi:D-glycero-D-manno-heptose 1,7-bisphosphate phosphatase